MAGAAGSGGAAGAGGTGGVAMLDPKVDVTLAYEGFEGAPGSSESTASGVGWSQAWSLQNESLTGQLVIAGNLAYPGLASSGGRGSGATSSGRLFAVMDNGPFGDLVIASGGERYIGATGKTIWVSFVIQKNAADDAAVSVHLGRSHIAWIPEDKNPVRVGFFGNDSKKDGKRHWAMTVVNDASDGRSAYAWAKEIEIGKPTLMVLKLEFGAPHKVSLYVNPASLMGAEPGVADATLTTMGNLPFRGLQLSPGSNSGAIDEVRVGRTYASVTPRTGVSSIWAPPPSVTIPADSELVVNRVRIAARPRFGTRLLRARIKGSNSSETTNFEDIGVIEYPPAEGALTDYVFNNTRAFRYVKLVSAPGAHVNAAEVEFYGGKKKHAGRGFGSSSSLGNDGNTYEKALDGNVTTFFNAVEPGDAYVGLDLGTAETQVATPTFSVPAGNIAADSVQLTIATTTPGASIRCTIDGSWPSATNGTDCAGSRTFTKAQTPGGRGKLALRAIALKNGLFESVVAVGTYYLNFAGVDVTTFHLGNSLTDTLNGHFAAISAAIGKDHTFLRCTIPGAPTDWIWANEGCFGVGTWQTLYANPDRFGRLDHQSTQPFSGHGRDVANESDHALKFLAAARAGGSSTVQPWIYAQWPTRTWDDNYARAMSPLAAGDSYPYARAAVDTFEKATLNHMAFMRSLKKAMDAGIAADPAKYGTKPAKIIPGPLALFALLHTVYNDDLQAFLAAIYEDGVHLTSRGAYYISLLAFAAIFEESPEDKEDSHYKTIGLSEGDAKALQRLAWATWAAFAADASYWPKTRP